MAQVLGWAGLLVGGNAVVAYVLVSYRFGAGFVEEIRYAGPWLWAGLGLALLLGASWTAVGFAQALRASLRHSTTPRLQATFARLYRLFWLGSSLAVWVACSALFVVVFG